MAFIVWAESDGAVQARATSFCCKASVHVRDTAAPVLTLAVHATA